MFDPLHPGPRSADPNPAGGQEAPAGLPALWITRLTCPTCHTPEALLLLDGVGAVCRECGETTRIQLDPPEVDRDRPR